MEKRFCFTPTPARKEVEKVFKRWGWEYNVLFQFAEAQNGLDCWNIKSCSSYNLEDFLKNREVCEWTHMSAEEYNAKYNDILEKDADEILKEVRVSLEDIWNILNAVSKKI